MKPKRKTKSINRILDIDTDEENNYISAAAPTLSSTTNSNMLTKLGSSIILANDNNPTILPSNNTNTLLISSPSFANVNISQLSSATLHPFSSSSSDNISSSFSTSNTNNRTSLSSNLVNGTTTSSNALSTTGRKFSSKVWLYATKSDDGKTAMCNLCDYACSSKSHSTSTIRNHLIRKHKKNELIITESSSKSTPKISERFKREMHSLCYNAIITDNRPFNDFRKKGLLAIFKKLCPGMIISILHSI